MNNKIKKCLRHPTNLSIVRCVYTNIQLDVALNLYLLGSSNLTHAEEATLTYYDFANNSRGSSMLLHIKNLYYCILGPRMNLKGVCSKFSNHDNILLLTFSEISESRY